MKTMMVMAALALIAAPALAEVVTLDLTAADAGTFYVDSDDASVWEENGICAELQKVDTNCILEPEGEPVVLEPADGRVSA